MKDNCLNPDGHTWETIWSDADEHGEERDGDVCGQVCLHCGAERVLKFDAIVGQWGVLIDSPKTEATLCVICRERATEEVDSICWECREKMP